MLIKVPLSWLKEHVDVSVGVDELARRLTMSGTEVDKIERPGEGWDRIWVGQVTAIEPHPNADSLLLATVDYGDGRRNTVVTGATNLKVGDLVPYAETGARLRDEGGGTFALEPKKVRGVRSDAMVCSARELGLGEDHEGILILPAALPIGAPLADVLGDPILLLELQPNRPDCLGVVGIAREVAALLDVTLREPPGDALRVADLGDRLRVRIEDPDACPRFAAALLEGVRPGPSPEWMQRRLVAAGMRPIDVVVDVTNYVMLELGQPLHAYDADRLAGRALVARRASAGERLRTLDGIERLLRPTDLVIADEERALGIAGVIGGEDSEIRPTTTTVALECASFEPRGIGRTATALGLHGSSGSAAARRFAWELSRELVPIALARAVRLLREHAGARLAGAVDVYPRPRARANVRLRFSDVTRVLGIEIPKDEVVSVLRRLGFTHAEDGDTLVVTAPSIRTDIGIPEDVVEEVARIVGFDRIPVRMPSGPLPAHEPHPLEEFREQVRDVLVGFGLQEVVCYPLVDPSWLAQLAADGETIGPEPLRVQNPTTVTQSVLRTTLRPSLLDTARRNVRHDDRVAIFEIAPVYLPRAGDLPEERWTIGILLAGRAKGGHWLERDSDFDVHDLRGVVSALHGATRSGRGETTAGALGLHPRRSWMLRDGAETAVTAGQLDPRVAARWDLPAATFVAELDLAAMLASRRPTVAAVPPRYPPALRDLAIVVDEAVPYGAVESEIRDAAKALLGSATLLDVYRGDQVGAGKKSLTVRLVLRSATGTLAEADVEKVVRRVEGRLAQRFGATLR